MEFYLLEKARKNDEFKSENACFDLIIFHAKNKDTSNWEVNFEGTYLSYCNEIEKIEISDIDAHAYKFFFPTTQQ